MTKVTVSDIQNRFGDFLDRAKEGESFVIVENDRPVAELRPIPNGKDHGTDAEAAQPPQRDFSGSFGKWSADPEFDAILAEQRRIDPELWK